jgi:hypothetical protein
MEENEFILINEDGCWFQTVYARSYRAARAIFSEDYCGDGFIVREFDKYGNKVSEHRPTL